MSDKLCKDCKHFRRTWSGWWLSPLANKFAKCAAKVRNEGGAEVLISGYGRVVPVYYYCATMREDFGDCKPQGLLWVPKNA